MRFVGGQSLMIVSTAVSGGFGLMYAFIPDGVETLQVRAIAQKNSPTNETITVSLETRPPAAATSPSLVDSDVFNLAASLGDGEILAPLTAELQVSAAGMHRITFVANAGVAALYNITVHGE